MLHRVRRFCEGLLGRQLSLAGVTGRAKVHLHGRVTSPNAAASPVSPVRAAVLTWALVRAEVRRQSNGEHYIVHRVMESETLRDSLLIETDHGTVLLPPCELAVVYATPITRNPQQMMGSPPERFRRAMIEDRIPGEVLYSERYISQGDRVALRAVVERLDGAGAGPYRGREAPADFAVLPSAEKPRMAERDSPPDM